MSEVNLQDVIREFRRMILECGQTSWTAVRKQGMQMLIRSMSPVVVAVDELGKEEDFKAVEAVIHCGCRLIATAHGDSVEETLSQPFFQKLWEARVFQRYIFLGKHDRAGIVEGIYDGNGKCLCTEL